MSTVYVSAGAVDSGALAPGDYVLRRVEDEVDVGRMGEGGLVWMERMPIDQLVVEAAADVRGADGFAAGEHQPELLTAVRGIETAVLSRGG